MTTGILSSIPQENLIFKPRSINGQLRPGERCIATGATTNLALPLDQGDRPIEVLNNTETDLTISAPSPLTIEGVDPFRGGISFSGLASVLIPIGGRGQFSRSGAAWVAKGCQLETFGLLDYARFLTANAPLSMLGNGAGTVVDPALAAEVAILSGSQTISSNTNWGSSTADSLYTIIRVDGNLTINSGATVTTLTRKLGLILYVNGSLTVNGTLTMTARGANHSSSGSNILPTDILVTSKAATAAARIIPAIGSSDKAKTFFSANAAGDTGNTGSNGGAGGGGTGGGFSGTSTGRGGTCFGGGAGGGAVYSSVDGNINSSATANGGQGGAGSNAISQSQSHGGGAGNPGGLQDRGAGGTTFNGNPGTGGVLIVYAAGAITVGATGVISANGVQANSGTPTRAGGGSGGGIVRVFSGTTIANNGSIQAAGGAASPSGFANGGAGGAGSVHTEVI